MVAGVYGMHREASADLARGIRAPTARHAAGVRRIKLCTGAKQAATPLEPGCSRTRSGFDPPGILYNSYGTQSNVTPLDEQAFLKHFNATPGGFRVMFQGSFVREKNLINLVSALQRLNASVKLFLLGDGPIAADLRKLCRRQHIFNVFFGPWVPQKDLLRYISHADLGVIPYSGSTILNNLYCTPNKLFEFIEAEIPICASDLPELRGIVAGNSIGNVYPMEDAESIACAIEACRARCLSGDFASSALRAARDRFSWERQGAKLLELYERLGV